MFRESSTRRMDEEQGMFLDISPGKNVPGHSLARKNNVKTDAIILRVRNIITRICFVEKSEEMVSQPYENTSTAGSGPWSYRSHTSLLWGPGHLCPPRKVSIGTVGWREAGGG